MLRGIKFIFASYLRHFHSTNTCTDNVLREKFFVRSIKNILLFLKTNMKLKNWDNYCFSIFEHMSTSILFLCFEMYSKSGVFIFHIYRMLKLMTPITLKMTMKKQTKHTEEHVAKKHAEVSACACFMIFGNLP